MTATIEPATSGSRPEPISATYRRLRRMDFGDPEAANLTAYVSGIAIGAVPWTVRELTHLLFLRELAFTRGEWSGADDCPGPSAEKPASAPSEQGGGRVSH